jgi:hypothetical protein
MVWIKVKKNRLQAGFNDKACGLLRAEPLCLALSLLKPVFSLMVNMERKNPNPAPDLSLTPKALDILERPNRAGMHMPNEPCLLERLTGGTLMRLKPTNGPPFGYHPALAPTCGHEHDL